MRTLPLVAAAVLAAGLVAPVTATDSSAGQAPPGAVSTAGPQCDDLVDKGDFNGDGRHDVAFGAPGVWVGGQRGAGLVTVNYGGGRGGGSSESLSQMSAEVGGEPEVDDGFGAVLGQVDVDLDNCTDLVVGVPGEDIGGARDAGMVQVVFGSPDGLGRGRPSLDLFQGGYGLGGEPEPGDRFGAALGLPWRGGRLVIGVPGEDVGTRADAGMAHQVWIDAAGRPGSVANLTQDSPGVDGVAEAGDAFGSSVGVGGTGFFVSAPGESLGARRAAGLVHFFGSPTSEFARSQDSPGVGGVAEAGDRFGAAADVTPVGTGQDVFAVGVPGEDLGGKRDAGMVQVFRLAVTSAGGRTLTQEWSANQDSPSVRQVVETGDRFGARIHFVDGWNVLPDPVLAVGVPTEDVGSVPDAGVVHQFTVDGAAPGAHDVIYLEGQENLTDEDAQAGERFGSSLGHGIFVLNPWARLNYWLFIGVPDEHDSGGAIFAVSPVFGSAPQVMESIHGGDRFGAGLP